MRGARDREPAVAPLWVRAEAEAASFAPRRIGPRRKPAWLIAGVAIASLAMVVALSRSGSEGLDGAGAARASAAASVVAGKAEPSTLVAVRPPAIGRVEAGLGVTPVALTLPPPGDHLVTSASITVDGELEVHATTLRIALEVDRLHHLGTITLDATDPNGGLRPDWPLRFHTELALPTPRPSGRLWLVITAYNRAGDLIGTLRQAMDIGPPARLG